MNYMIGDFFMHAKQAQGREGWSAEWEGSRLHDGIGDTWHAVESTSIALMPPVWQSAY